ncbi:hypothetical protein DN468_26985, partial [Burkholderia multivorans]
MWKSECGRTVPIYRVLVPESVNDEILEAWKARGYRYTAGSPSAIMVTPGMRRNFFRTSATFKGGTAAGTAVTARLAAPGGVALLTGFLDAALTFGVL